MRLRHGVGDACDSDACLALARAIVDGFRNALRTTTFFKADGSHIHLRLLVSVLEFSSNARTLWNAFMDTLAAGVAHGDAEAERRFAEAATEDSRMQLHMVFQELVQASCNMSLGVWPKGDLLGEPDAAAIALAAQEGGAAEGAEDEGGASAGGAADDDTDTDLDALLAACIEPGCEWRPVPVAIAGMAGAAISRIMRKLLAPARRKALMKALEQAE